LLTHHISKEIATHQTPRLGLVPEDQILKLSFVLPLRNESKLDSLLSQLYDRQSPLYHQWLSVQEFTERFGPTPDDYETVVEFAKANGMNVTVTPANRRLVGVESSVANINRAFHVTMGIYQHPYEKRTYYTPDREPTVDLSVPLLHVAGLSNIATARSMLRHDTTPEALRAVTTGSAPGGQYYGSDMRAAYYGGTALTGAGQSIGIYGMDYNISDIEAYFASAGQAFDPSIVQDYSADGTVNSCGTGCDDGEPVADITESLSMAPAVDSVIVYFGASQEEVFNEMASANAAKQLSTSELYWYSPAPATSFDGIFKEFAAQGQNLFAASGDSGGYNSSNIPYFPTDDPYVTAVGGTDLTTTGPGGSWQSESAWIGSGGGLDTYQSYPIPSYQQLSGVIDSANQGSTTIRNIPDVAIEANTDNWYCINGNPCTGGLGGTSLAAPRWAGFLALVNEQAANNGNPSVGFLNPTIYAIGTGANYDSDFHDITTGNNNDKGTGGYNAVTGYDLVTGWGSPSGQAFIDALAGSTKSFTLSAAPGTLTVAQGGSGTSTITVTGENGFSGNVTLTAVALPSGVTATFTPNPAPGTSTLTLAASSTAALGSATVTIQGASGSLNATTTLALTVQAAPSFKISTSTSSLSVAQGSSGTTTLTITGQNGFTGTVTFSAAGLPNGVTATFTPNPAPGTSTLTLAASSTAALGSATVTIQGASGSLNATTTLALTVQAAPSFTINASTSSLSVAQSSSGTATLTIAGQNGFAGAVTFSAAGLPNGVTATFSPNPATGASTLTLAASSTAALGSATVTIQGASGALNATTTLALTVQAAPSFTINASTSSLSVAQSSSGTATLTIAGQNGFAGAVTFSAAGLPNGVTATFTPNPATGASTLTLAANSTATLGSATVTIQGVSASLSESSNIALTVSPLPTFSLALSQSSVTLAPNQTTSLHVLLSSSQGYQGTVQLSCSGLPATITCSFSPTSVTLPASSGDSTLTLTELPTTAYLAPKTMRIPWSLELSCCGLGILGLLRARRPIRWSSRSLFVLALLLGAGFLGMAGCVQSLPHHTYTVSVTGIDANQQSHTLAFTLDATE
jgi:hypothetical protein